MRKNAQNTEESSEYIFPEQRKAAIARLEALEAEYATAPTSGLLAMIRQQQEHVRWFERKHGCQGNVGTVSLRTRPGKARVIPAKQPHTVPAVGLDALLPPA